MTELYSLPRSERVASLSESLGICADILDSEETQAKVRETLSRNMVTEYVIKISPTEIGECKTSIKVRQSRQSFEIKFMNGLNPAE